MKFFDFVHSIFFALIFAPLMAFLTPFIVALFWAGIITTWTGISPLELGEFGFLCVSAIIGFIILFWQFFFKKEEDSSYDSPTYYKVLFMLLYGVSLFFAVHIYSDFGF